MSPEDHGRFFIMSLLNFVPPVLVRQLYDNVFLYVDASYVDPLGPPMERPKTAAKKRVEEDDFADEELGDDLLPE